MRSTLGAFSWLASAGAAVCIAAGCTRRGGCRGDYCGTLVIAAPGEVTTLLPPVTDAALDRDVFDQLFLKLADIGPEANTIGERGFEPQLAERWEWTGPLTLTFHLDPRARWQDGRPVTASDVAFSFDVYADSVIDSPFRPSLRHLKSVTGSDSLTVVMTFRDRYPEMFYDAVYHVRVLPAHLLQSVPRTDWRTAAFGRAPVGDGPYRLVQWPPGQSLELVADSTFFLGRPHLRRLIWRFTADLTVAVTQVVAGEADAIQVLVSPANITRAEAAGHLATYVYPGSTYTLLEYNQHADGARTRPHPIFGDPDVRRAMVFATDRERMAQSVFAGHAKVPPAPIPQFWTGLWFPDLPVPPYDTAQAAALLARRGWRDTDHDGIRDRGGKKLSFHLAVPTTSAARKQYAQLIQEQLRAVGVDVVIDEMELATLQERTRSGHYDAALQSWNADPSPSSSMPQIWRANGNGNFTGYANPTFDRQVEQAVSAKTPDDAAAAWRAALTTLVQDAPAIMLYALDNVAAVDRRVTDVRLRPDSWWAYLRTWRIPLDRITDRDRVGR